MLHDLLRLDLDGWHPKRIYKTQALMEQKGHSLRGLDASIETMLQEGALPKPRRSIPTVAYLGTCLRRQRNSIVTPPPKSL